MTIICWPLLKVGFCFYYQLINLVCLSFDFFHLAEASLSAFLWLYTLVCAFVQKYHKTSFIYNYWHFQYWFCNQPALFSQLENVNKLWSNNCTVHVHKRNLKKTKPTNITFKLTARSVVRFSPQEMHWYQERMASLFDVRVKSKISCQ